MKNSMRAMTSVLFAVGIVLLLPQPAGARAKLKTSQQLRTEYLERVMQSSGPTEEATLGSLWVDSGRLANLASDYKAAHAHDTIIIQVVQQTSAAAGGTTDAERSYDTSSAITALPGRLKVGGVNPLFGANSASKLKGQGQVSANSKLQTSLAGEVIAVLPNGNLVVEAQREVLLNHERETAIVRGVARPGDVGPNNVVLSTALANLEIELKGKGVISDATRPPNVIMRSLQWIFGF
ncbi:MAG TPA: flagellar basal body L-ring protein FlgH [Terriglobales bacterium]|nr:flagellar basal body L-ring protein FlgH [Terriglobales bacterium]